MNISVTENNALSNAYSYDTVPYVSYPYYMTRPEVMRANAIVFGLKPVALDNARVLELGCSFGNNIGSFAMNYPNSKCVGIDLSEVQIKQGKEFIEKVGIKNLELRHMSITDIDKDFGTFDYIICHGVFSWVPNEVREKIMSVIKNNLSADGLAHVSYNVFPGWNMANSVRELMMYHSTMFNTPQEKLNQSRLVLDFLVDTLKENKSPYAEFLKSEAELLRSKDNFYIYHEHLSENNVPMYFHQFVAMATNAGVSYLCDAHLSTMFVGNLQADVAQKLSQIGDNVRTEQYLDFIYNRRFRSSILCHPELRAKANLNVHFENLKNIFLSGNFSVDASITEEQCLNTDLLRFTLPSGSTADSNDPVAKLVLFMLTKNNNSLFTFDEVVESVVKKLKAKENKDNIRVAIGNMLLKLLFNGQFRVFSDKPACVSVASEKPFIHNYIREIAKSPMGTVGMWTMNHFGDIIAIGYYDKYAISYMDGTNNKDAIVLKLLEHCKTGDLVINSGNAKVEDEESQLNALRQIYDVRLEFYIANKLLSK